jgi:G2/mitotic-specific cyclin-B, other
MSFNITENPLNKEKVENPLKTTDSLRYNRKFGTNLTNTDTEMQSNKPRIPEPIQLNDYTSEIYKYLHSIESLFLPKFGYLKSQSDINEKMRSILVDWLVEVHLKFKLLPETLYLTVNILDRYLEKVIVTRNRLQLVGISAMMVASKYEEIYAPLLSDFLYVTGQIYTRDDVIKMESSILKSLSFKISCPSSYRFLERYSILTNFTEKQFSLARYFLELTLLEYKMLKFTYSLIAASSVYLAGKYFSSASTWDSVLVDNSPYIENDLKVCAKEICILFQKSNKNTLQAVKKKFMMPQYFQVANVTLI